MQIIGVYVRVHVSVRECVQTGSLAKLLRKSH